jgi:leucyl aminopeptidase
VTLERSTRPLHQAAAHALALQAAAGDRLSPAAQEVDGTLGGLLSRSLHEEPFEDRKPAVLVVRTGGAIEARYILLTRFNGETADAAREAAAAAALEAARLKAGSLAIEPFLADRLTDEEATLATAVGAYLGAYRFTAYKSRSRTVQRVVVQGGEAAAFARARSLAEAVAFARDLVNTPAIDLTPEALAERARALGQTAGITVTILDEKQAAKEGLTAFLAVAQGSTRNPPRFIRLKYSPKGRPAARLAFIGKGITFDTGGYSLKTAEGMLNMKADMGGAAAVLGAFKALAELKPQVEVQGFVPATENMVDGHSFRPGDVIRARNGKTIEIGSTDAEGRLILADALDLAAETSPDLTVDLATLTGACVVGLGPLVAGLFGSDEGVVERVRSAARAAGEKVWPMPLEQHYRDLFASEIADLKNTGGRQGGAIIAALFLSEFAKGPWAHLDIAGPAFTDKAHPLGPQGGTGFGVTTLVQLAFDLAAKPPERVAAPVARARGGSRKKPARRKR